MSEPEQKKQKKLIIEHIYRPLYTVMFIKWNSHHKRYSMKQKAEWSVYFGKDLQKNQRQSEHPRCSICQKNFKSLTGLNQHMSHQYPQQSSSSSSEPDVDVAESRKRKRKVEGGPKKKKLKIGPQKKKKRGPLRRNVFK